MNKKRGPKTKQKHNNHKDWIKGWKYEKDAPYDKKWQEDRRKLFAEAGNGWWWYVGVKTRALPEEAQKHRKEMEPGYFSRRIRKYG